MFVQGNTLNSSFTEDEFVNIDEFNKAESPENKDKGVIEKLPSNKKTSKKEDPPADKTKPATPSDPPIGKEDDEDDPKNIQSVPKGDQSDLDNDDDDQSLDISEELIFSNLEKTVKEKFEDFPDLSTKNADAFIDNVFEYQKNKVIADAEFINTAKKEKQQEYGLDDETISTVFQVKYGANPREILEWSSVKQLASLNGEDDEYIDSVLTVYHKINSPNLKPEDLKRYIDADKADPEVVESRKTDLFNLAVDKLTSIENDAKLNHQKTIEAEKKYADQVRVLLDKRTIDGVLFTKDEIDTYLDSIKPGTTEIILPSGQKKMVSKHQAKLYKEKTESIEKSLANHIKQVLGKSNDSMEFDDKRKKKIAGNFMKKLNEDLKKEGVNSFKNKNVKDIPLAEDEFIA